MPLLTGFGPEVAWDVDDADVKVAPQTVYGPVPPVPETPTPVPPVGLRLPVPPVDVTVPVSPVVVETPVPPVGVAVPVPPVVVVPPVPPVEVGVPVPPVVVGPPVPPVDDPVPVSVSCTSRLMRSEDPQRLRRTTLREPGATSGTRNVRVSVQAPQTERHRLQWPGLLSRQVLHRLQASASKGSPEAFRSSVWLVETTVAKVPSTSTALSQDSPKGPPTAVTESPTWAAVVSRFTATEHCSKISILPELQALMARLAATKSAWRRLTARSSRPELTPVPPWLRWTPARFHQ